MARFDIYPHPDAALRRATPYLMDVQNTYLAALGTRIVIPLRAASALPSRLRDLNPVLLVNGKEVVVDTASLAAFPASELRAPVAHARNEAADVVAALDTLFGAC